MKAAPGMVMVEEEESGLRDDRGVLGGIVIGSGGVDWFVGRLFEKLEKRWMARVLDVDVIEPWSYIHWCLHTVLPG